MPDFTARITSGTTLAPWDDHAAGSAHSRINPLIGRPTMYQKAAVGVPVTMKARIDTGGLVFVEGPADSALGGRLFTSDLGEFPAAHPASPTGAATHSSIQTFTPNAIGHYLWVMRRPDGGAVAIHLDCE